MLLAGRGTWAYDLLNELGIPIQILPEIIDSCNFVGKLRKSVQDELGINEIPVIAVASHDTGSAVISAPLEDSNDAYISSGTWSLLGTEREKPVINEKTLKYNYTNEGGINRTVRLLVNIMGLWVYQECRRAWRKQGIEISYDEMDAMAEAAKPFQSFIDVDDETFIVLVTCLKKWLNSVKNRAECACRQRKYYKNCNGEPCPEIQKFSGRFRRNSG